MHPATPLTKSSTVVNCANYKKLTSGPMKSFRSISIISLIALISASFGVFHLLGNSNTQLLSPGFCPIEHWGPRNGELNTGFNLQPDGNSALWVVSDCFPDSVAFSFGGKVYDATRDNNALTTLITDIRPLNAPGDIEVSLIDKSSGRRQHVGMFTVKPGGKPKEPAPGPVKAVASTNNMPALTAPRLISHAGGGYKGKRYRNSIEALDYNYALGHRMFEVDFSWTADQRLVGIHDWGNTYQRLFPTATHEQRPTYVQLLELLMDNNESVITLPRLRHWLTSHPDAYIVTDIKGKNVAGLTTMKQVLGAQYRQVVPQLYHPHNYQALRKLGYQNIIFTLYATHLSTEKIAAFVANNPLLAVTIHPDKKGFSELIPQFNELHRFVYVHTYNSLAEYNQYRELGVDGVYTDFLIPDGGQSVREPGSG